MGRIIHRTFFSVLAVLAGACACLYLFCTFNVAGSVTEGGNVEIAGVIVDSLGHPVQGANIVLRPSNYLKDTSGTMPPRNVAASAVTDQNGSFIIDSIGTGEYCIAASKGDSQAALIRFGVQPNDTLVPLDSTPLVAAAEINGTVLNQSTVTSAMYVQVYGLEKIAKVDSATGAYRFTAVPAGSYRLQVLISSPKYNPVVIPDVQCLKGENKTIDTVTIAPFTDENYTLWPGSKKIMLNTTATGANVGGTVTAFPVLVRLRAPDFTFSQFLPDGRDMRFANSRGDHLPFEIERFDPYGGIADVWVLVDTIRGNDSTAITMYWGNMNAAAHSLASVVFDTALGYRAVWHCNDRALNERMDATYNRFNALPNAYEGDEWTYGVIGGCDSLDDNDDKLKAPDIDPDIDADAALTLSLWVNSYELTSSLRQFCIAKAGPVAGKQPLYSIMINENQQLAMNVTANGRADSVAGGSIALNRWYLITGTYDGSAIKVYLDSALVGSKSVAGAIDTSRSNVYIGYFDKLSQKLHGKIDEVRIMRTAASADWVRLNYENQKPNGTLVKFVN
jgi:hypothetical protein